MWMSLGGIIEFLSKRDPNLIVPMGFHNPHSYRGIYEDLAFEPKANTTVGEMLNSAKEALGSTYQGYKGGDFRMGDYTTCWISEYGESSAQSIGEILLKYMVGEF